MQVQIPANRQLCPSEGTFGFPNDCQSFVKCTKDIKGVLSGKILNIYFTRIILASESVSSIICHVFLILGKMFQCAEGQSYGEKSKKCERNRKIPMCNKTGPKLNWQTSLAPVLSDA